MLNKHISLEGPMGNKPKKPCSLQILFIYLFMNTWNICIKKNNLKETEWEEEAPSPPGGFKTKSGMVEMGVSSS